MTPEKLIELKVKAKVLIALNDNYLKYIYLTSFQEIKQEKSRLITSFGY